MVNVIYGKKIAAAINHGTRQQIVKHKLTPVLALIAVLTGKPKQDKASKLFIKLKAKKAQALGVFTKKLIYPNHTTTKQLVGILNSLNQDKSINGVIVQLPLPEHIDTSAVQSSISPDKDADGANPLNLGRLLNHDDGYYPVGCTAKGILDLIYHSKLKHQLKNKRTVIVGNTSLIGRPLSVLLMNRGCIVSVLPRYLSKQVRDSYLKSADIIIADDGVPTEIQAEDIGYNRPVIIDAGEYRDETVLGGFLVGNVDLLAKHKADNSTPVPGGVGPMIIAELMRQVVDLTKHQVLS